jgi:DNA-binding beta-propeller fold protein YncE
VSYFTGEFYQVDVAVTPDAERVYVLVNVPSGNDYVYVYEKDEAAWDWTYKSRILVSNSPHALHYDPTNERLYVATRHYWAVDVYFVAGDANLWTGSIFYDDLDLAQGVVSAPAWNKFFVSLADGTLATYAPPDDEDPPEDPVLTHLEPLGVYPWAVAANSSTGKVYAACQSTGDTSDVYVARIPGYKKRIPVLGDAETVSVNAATNKVYVSHGGDVDQISVIDGATDQVSGTTIDLWSRELAVNSTTNRIYVLQGSRYQVIDGSNDTILCSVETVSNLQHIAVDEVLDKVYVNSTFPGKEMHVFEGGCSPPAPVALAISEFGDIAVDSAHHLVYVADLSAPFHVVVVNGTTNLEVTKVPVDIYPRSLAVDPVTRTVFVASHESEEVRLIDAVTNTPLGYSLTVDSEVWGLGVDAAAGRTYTANKNAGTLSLLDAVTIFFDSFEDGSFSGWTAIGIGASPAVP